ncbi:hypothetical protein N5I05_04920 [Acinetobacter johnsonii]|uniref:hypothetical protein n=1 Tax=Acinetobacter johnsonii TaxID=40214 RepID=UPI0024492DDE|nr:hypothetical protein [Acinetobacter johnsonii]MDH1697896.1 hypothetical protein [Acinetobacter johnsonii]
MTKHYFTRVLLASLCVTSTLRTVSAADVAASSGEVSIQRSFVNLNFSQPDIRGYSSSGAKLAGNTNTSQTNVFLTEAEVPGWRTTHPIRAAGTWNQAGRLIEIWRAAGAAALPNTSNDQYAELNADAISALYQNVCLFGGEQFTWSFKHAGRNLNTAESLKFHIGTITGSSISSLQTIVSDTVTRTSSQTTMSTRWKSVSVGNTAETVRGGIPTTGGVYSFIFEATNGSTEGNFLDEIKIGLKPAVEFSASSNKYYEGNDNTSGKTQAVPFNIVGQILSQDDMPTLNFKVDYPPNYSGVKAVYGVNYKLYKQDGTALVELGSTDGLSKSNQNTSITFNYTPVYNSALDYTKGVQVNGLVIGILGNTTVNADITVPFSFALDPTSKAIATSLSSCGNSQADVKFDLNIQEDDVDLSVVKALTSDSLTIKDRLVSYTLDVENKTTVQADSVFLRDSFKNLQRITTTGSNQTTLMCEDITDGNSKACPTQWTDANALTALFSNTAGTGLSLGDIPAKAKYRFTIKNLLVTDTDTSTNGQTVNTATIETTAMSDFEPSNNISTVQKPIIGKSDLSNNKANAPTTETGVGIFNIAQGGRTGAALLTKSADNTAKVYFPLNIQNDSAFAQDYKLYASRTSVEPTLNNTDYSTLVQSGINPFTSGLRVEFYPLTTEQCKAGMTGQSISQLNISAKTTAQVCAVVSVLPSASTSTNIWFAIESVQTGFGDVILDAVSSLQAQQRQLILVNDQQAQIRTGGTFVFAHRLTNQGRVTESGIKLSVNLLKPNDGFLYTLFIDQNGDGLLDGGDVMVKDSDRYQLQAGEQKAILVKVEAPTSAVNGMTSQVELIATPDNTNQSLSLSPISNKDLVTIGINQITLHKTQFKQPGCTDMSALQVVNAAYQIGSTQIGRNDCIVYRIMVKNMGEYPLTNVEVSDMYPAYTTPWNSNNILPMKESGEKVTPQGKSVSTIFTELLPNQQKSLYFGIRLQP